MLQAIVAVTLLLAPWALAYVALGVVAGPAMLAFARRRYRLRLHLAGDLPRSVVAWPVLGAWLIHMGRSRPTV